MAKRIGIEQGRADYAYESVEALFTGKSLDNKKLITSYIKRLPMMIKVNGLGQALAFYQSKGGNHKLIYDEVGKWVESQEYVPNNRTEFVKKVIALESTDYRMVTMETLALLNWMRRFADGMKHE